MKKKADKIQSQKVLELLKKSKVHLTPEEISAKTDVPTPNVRTILGTSKHIADMDIVKVVSDKPRVNAYKLNDKRTAQEISNAYALFVAQRIAEYERRKLDPVYLEEKRKKDIRAKIMDIVATVDVASITKKNDLYTIRAENVNKPSVIRLLTDDFKFVYDSSTKDMTIQVQ
jgi:hypothetical protein